MYYISDLYGSHSTLGYYCEMNMQLGQDLSYPEPLESRLKSRIFGESERFTAFSLHRRGILIKFSSILNVSSVFSLEF